MVVSVLIFVFTRTSTPSELIEFYGEDRVFTIVLNLHILRSAHYEKRSTCSYTIYTQNNNANKMNIQAIVKQHIILRTFQEIWIKLIFSFRP